ncbi:MAG: InlB B-repeat-containing protein [Clostridia bacterium]|nr:InlB B-repeat-containing protein [Clostridia bacterium]
MNGAPLTSGSPIKVSFAAHAAGVAPDYYDVVVDPASVTVWSNDGLAADLTQNYAVSFDTGLFEITPRVPGDTLEMVIYPADKEEYYQSKPVVVTVRDVKLPTLVSGLPIDAAAYKLDFVATGTGFAEGTYPIDIADVTDPAQFTVYAVGAGGALIDVTNQFVPIVIPGELRILNRQDGDKIPLYIRPLSSTVTFNGKVQTFNSDNQGTVWILGMPVAPAIQVTFEARASGFAIGTYYVEPTKVKVTVGMVDVTDNYHLTPDPGRFVINPTGAGVTMTIVPVDADSVTFDGKPHSGIVTEGKIFLGADMTPVAMDNDVFTVTFVARSVQKTAPGTYPVKVAVPEILVMSKDGKNITSQFAYVTEDSSFTINPVAPGNEIEMRIAPSDATEKYAGKPVSAHVTTAKSPILVAGQPKLPTLLVDFVAVGTGIAVGTYPIDIADPANPAQFAVRADGPGGLADVTDQFVLVTDPGTLTIRPLTGNEKLPLYIVPNGGILPFNGDLQTLVRDNDPEILWISGKAPNAWSVVDFKASGSGANIGKYPVNVTGHTVYVDGMDMTDNYMFLTDNGWLTIRAANEDEKITLRIIPDDIPSVVFDGMLHEPTTSTGTVFANSVPVTAASGVKVEFVAKADPGVAPGAYTVRVVSVAVLSNDGLFTDLTANYIFDHGTGLFTILPVEAGGERTMTVFPADREAAFALVPVEVQVSDSRSPALVDGSAMPAGMTVGFLARGRGHTEGTYPITVESADMHLFEVMAPGVGGAPVDVTDQFTLVSDDGTLTIRTLTDGKIPLYVRPDDATVHFSGTMQAYNKDNQGTVLIDGVLPADDINVTFNARRTELVPGTYEVPPTDVKVMIGTQDITGNFELVAEPGYFTILRTTESGRKVPVFIALDDADDRMFNGMQQQGIVTTGLVEVGDEKIPWTPGGSDLYIAFTAKSDYKTAPGTYPVKLESYAVFGPKSEDLTIYFDVFATDGNFTITPVSPGEKIEMTMDIADRVAVYTGAYLTVEVTTTKTPIMVSGMPIDTNLTVVFRATGTGYTVGTYPIAIQNVNDPAQFMVMADGADVTDQFVLTATNGTFSIMPITDPEDRIPLYIKPDSGDVFFDGTEQSFVSDNAGTVWIAGNPILPDGLEVLFDASAKGTAPGTYPVNARNVKVLVYGQNMIDNYDLILAPGQFIIKPRETGMTLSILPDNPQSVTFNGQKQGATVDTGDIALDGQPLPAGGPITVEFVAKAEGGVAPGSYPVEVDESSIKVYVTQGDDKIDVTENFEFDLHDGVFIIRKVEPGAELSMELFPENAERLFNGSKIAVAVTEARKPILVEGNAMNGGLTVTFVARGEGVAVGTYAIDIDDPADPAQFQAMAQGMNGSSVDVTDQFKLTVDPGELSILPTDEKIPLFIRPNDMTAPFTGRPYTLNSDNDGTVLIDGLPLPSGTTVEFEARVTGMAPGLYEAFPQAVKVWLSGVDATDQYLLITEPGTLTITPPEPGQEIPIQIEPNTPPSVTFTGKPQKAVVTEGNVTYGILQEPIDEGDIAVTFVAESAEATAPGGYAVTVVDWKVIDKRTGLDITSCYQLTSIDAIFTIHPAGADEKIQMLIAPSHSEKPFTGSPQSVFVTDARLPITVDGLAIGTSLRVAFVATGSGTVVGDHPITIQDPTDLSQFKVMAKDAEDNWFDVTDAFELLVDEGLFSIKPLMHRRIAITVGVVDPEPLTYNGTEQTITELDGVILDAAEGYDPTDWAVVIHKQIKGTDAGDYPIALDPNDVTVLIGGVDVSNQFDVFTVEGLMRIEKQAVTGTLTAVRPGASYVYGAAIPEATAVLSPPPLNALGLVYSVLTDEEVRNVGTYEYAPVLFPLDNPNYEVTGIQLVKSEPMLITRASLTVTPDALEIAQGSLEYTVTATVSGYRYADSMTSAGPNDIKYVVKDYTRTNTIGQSLDIVKLSGAEELANYSVVYNDLKGGASIYGQVTYHSNYPAGESNTVVTAPEKYDSPSDRIEVKPPTQLGIADHGYEFLGWATDTAGSTAFTDGSPIGNTSVTLYAKWNVTFKATFQYQDWVREVNIHVDPLPLEAEYDVGESVEVSDALFGLPGFTGRYALVFPAGGVGASMVPWGWSFIMPKEDVAVILRYSSGE